MLPAWWLAYLAVRRTINANWERGLHDARTGRVLSKSAKAALEFPYVWTSTDSEDVESEDDHLHDGCGPPGKFTRCRSPGDASPTVAAGKREQLWPRASSACGILSEPAALSGQGSNLSEPAALLGQSRHFADLDKECLEFLLGCIQVLAFQPGELVFEQGGPRKAFLMVRSGQVLVEAWPPEGGGRRGEEYCLGVGDTVVGLLFMLASLDAVQGAAVPPPACCCHSSTARAGRDGAEVVAVPTEAFTAAFEQFPAAMQTLVRRLCMRLALVVFETLSTYFGLSREFMVASSYRLLDLEPAELAGLAPAEVFARSLGRAAASSGVAEVLACAVSLEHEAGEYVLPPQQRATHVLVLVEGQLELHMCSKQPPGSSGAGPVASGEAWGKRGGGEGLAVRPGEAIGALSTLIDRPEPVSYRCATRCRFAALPRDASQRLFQLCPRAWCLKLLHLVAARTASWLHRVDAALEWLPVEGGRCLFRRGDAMSGFFVVLSGRLVALEELAGRERRGSGPAGGRPCWRVTDVLQRGRLCGELDCLRGVPYSQTVRASRDTEVCRVSPTFLQLIAMDFPKAVLHFSSLVGPQKPPATGLSARNKVTITVVPASEEVDVHEVCALLTSSLSSLGKTLHVSPDMDLAGPRSGKAGAARSLDGPRLARVLAELEERCRWLVYEAEPASGGRVTDWTRRCVRQADHILVALNFDGRGRGDVPAGENERYVEEAAPLYVERDLLLLHASGVGGRRRAADDWSASASAADLLRPGLRGFVAHHTQQLFLGHRAGGALRSTRHYLHARPWARRWHHVRAAEPKDWARCARLLAGRGVGLCLGGGGARGNCHFGVVRALEELGVPIDAVSGTSFGALAGAVYCMSAPQPGSLMRTVNRVMGRQFSTRKMLMDLNFPRTSYFTGQYINSILKETFARRRCEDLLVPFMCTSTDIVQFDAKTHREGPLWRIVRASMSLAGFVPPLPYQERRIEDGTISSCLLVDGGYSNQYPIEALKQHGAGCVICVVACPDYAPVCTDYGDVVRGGLITLQRTFGCRRRSAPDPPSQAEIQERLMFLVESMKEPYAARADLTIYPDIEAYGLLDFAKYREIAAAGYRAALPRLREWLAGTSEAAQLVREAADGARDGGRPPPSANEVEYGTRRHYATWRKHWREYMALRATRLIRGVASFSSSPTLPGVDAE